MGGLYYFTFAINFLGLIMALWLGIYLVSHSARYGLAWLSALTLWSLGGWFINVLLAIDPPDPAAWPAWLRIVFISWPECARAGISSCWLEGWLCVPALALWHHVTTLMPPGSLTSWRRGRILGGYLVVIAGILVQTINPIVYAGPDADPLFINSLRTGALYPLMIAALITVILSSLYNLVQTALTSPKALPRGRLWILVQATLIAMMVAPISIVGTGFQQPLPVVIFSLAIFIPIVLFAHGVLSYSTAMESRTLRRDFLYNMVMMSIVVLAYTLAGWIMINAYQAPKNLLVILPAIAVITHSLINPLYRFLDRLFFQGNAHQIRSNLRRLLHLAGESKPFEDSLAETLKDLCTSVSASFGLIVVFEGQELRRAAAFQFDSSLEGLHQSELACDDVESIRPGQLRQPLGNAALLVPLYADDSQVGTLLLGRPENGEQYAEEEVEGLMVLSDYISDVVYINQLKTRTIRQLLEQAESQRHPAGSALPLISSEDVEVALRNLHDYTFLADSPLSKLQLVQRHMEKSGATHLERGKAVHDVLLAVLEKMCPSSSAPHNPPQREWHAYLILHAAYQEKIPNRDIMMRLYISEGTFNRTRRAAIRSVTRALGEMEAAVLA